MQFAPVSAEVAPPVVMAILCFSLATAATASATAELVMSSASSAPESNASRALRRRLGSVVAVIDGDDFDRPAEHFAAEVVDGHLGRPHGARPGEPGIDARHVGDDGDFDGTLLGGRRPGDG